MTQADSPTAGFRPFFNPATGEWITYTALAEDNGGAACPLHLAPAQATRNYRPTDGVGARDRARRQSTGRPSPRHRLTPGHGRAHQDLRPLPALCAKYPPG